MANSPSKVVLVAAAVMGIGAMVVLNSMNKTPKTEEEQEQEEQAQAQKNAPPPAAPPIGKPGSRNGTDPRAAVKAAKGTNTGNGDSSKASTLVGLGQDKIVGTSASGPEVNIRYSWTPAVQSDPKKVYDAVAAVKSAMPNARIHVINTDENPGAPDGVFVGSKQIAPAGADGSIAVSAAALKAAAGSGSK